MRESNIGFGGSLLIWVFGITQYSKVLKNTAADYNAREGQFQKRFCNFYCSILSIKAVRCLLPVFLIWFPLYGISQVPDTRTCDELIFYRDHVLAKDFFKAYDTYRLSVDAKKDIDRISATLLSDKAAWYEPFSSENAAPDWALLLQYPSYGWYGEI